MIIDFNFFLTLSAIFIAFSGTILFFKLDGIDKYVDNRKDYLKKLAINSNKYNSKLYYIIQNIGKFKQNEEIKENLNKIFEPNISIIYDEIIDIRKVRKKKLYLGLTTISCWVVFVLFLIPLSLKLIHLSITTFLIIILFLIIMNILMIFLMLNFNKDVDAKSKLQPDLSELLNDR